MPRGIRTPGTREERAEWREFQRSRRRRYATNFWLTTELMRRLAASHGGTFVSPHYKPRPAKLEWRCAKGHVFYLANARAHSYGELMDAMLAGLERGAVRVPLPDRVVRLLGAVAEDVLAMVGKGAMFNRDKAKEMTQKYWVCSPAKAKRELDWEARVPLDRGLRETLAWYRQNEWV